MSRFGVAVCDWDGRTKDLAEAVSKTMTERVYLCVEDRHVLYRQDNVHEAIQDFIDMGLEVILDPWGVAGRFAGETTSHHKHMFHHWLQFAETTKATSIMLDEPLNIKDDLAFAIHQCRTFAPSKFVHLAVEPYKLQHLDDYLEGQKIDELSVSTYLFGKQISEATIDSIVKFATEMDKIVPERAAFWIQTWDIPAGQEWIPELLISLFTLRRPGAMMNIWAWDAFRTVSSKRPDNPDLVWAKILNKINS